MSFRLSLGMAMAGLLCAAACGGKVLWTPTGGDGGDGGASGSTTKAASTGKGSTTTNSVVSGVTSVSTGTSDVCQQLCALPGCVANVPMCLDTCFQLFVPNCEQQAQNYLLCALQFINPNTCSLDGDFCAFEDNSYQQCVNSGPCGANGQCSMGMGSCECHGFCFGNDIQAVCKASPMGIQCQCSMSGNIIGTCSMNGLNCDLQTGCCASFFGGVDDGIPPP